jgi:chemotaxis protein CheD
MKMPMGEEDILVGMGQYAVTHNPGILVSLSLGSCIGLTIFDKEAKIGGLAHIMLPSSKDSLKKGLEYNMNKFADVAIPSMVDDMKKMGAKTERMVAKLVGGAHMFPGILDADVMDIGRKNEAATKEELHNLGIKIVGSDTGGNVGRSVRFDTTTGSISIKTKDFISNL